MKFGFIAKHRGIWPVSWLCGALDVSRSGFQATREEIVFSERARDRRAGVPETQGERAHVALRLSLRHCHCGTVMELPALKRLQHLEHSTAGKAVEEDRRIAEPDGQAGRAIVMGRAAAFAAGATPHPAELFDDVLGSDFSIER